MSDISAVYLERADSALKAASLLLEGGFYSDTVSRCYYGAFYAAKAVLESIGCDRKSHQSVWAAFGQSVAKPGLMDRKFHRGGLDLFVGRINSDYLPRPVDTLKTAQQALSFAAEFVSACRAFLDSREKGA